MRKYSRRGLACKIVNEKSKKGKKIRKGLCRMAMVGNENGEVPMGRYELVPELDLEFKE